MNNKKWSVRIRKPLAAEAISQVFGDVLAALGGVATQVETIITNEGMELQEVIERVEEAAPEYEIISIVLIDTDNSDLFEDDFDWGVIE